MSDVDTTQAPAPAASPAADTTGDNGATGKTWTDDEVQAKLRGQGKELEKQKALIAKYQAEEKKRKDAELSKDEQLAALRQSEEASRQRVAEFEAKEEARIKEVEDSNAKRMKALPKELQAMVPDELPPDAKAKHLSTVESHARSGESVTVDVHGSPGRTKPELSPEDAANADLKAAVDKAHGSFFGGGKKDE